jgi:hypothetical protein
VLGISLGVIVAPYLSIPLFHFLVAWVEKSQDFGGHSIRLPSRTQENKLQAASLVGLRECDDKGLKRSGTRGPRNGIPPAG